MANINDFKIIAQKSKKYFDLLSKEFALDGDIVDSEKERLGFYLFVLEHTTGKKDISDLVDIITDTQFNEIVLGEKFDDCGVDAVCINDEDNIIQLFNFKYRNDFKESATSINNAVISTKFTNAILSQKTDDLKGKVKECADNIIEKFDSKDVWKLQLYVVSNEDLKVSHAEDLRRLEEVYGLEIITLDLKRVGEFITLRPRSVDAVIVLDKDAVMTFSESAISSSKSYIVRLPLSEVVRITCDDGEMRKKYNLEDAKNLSDVNLDFSVLFDNVRGFVTKSKFNKNILKTLEEEPNRFFIYNNGLTLTAENIEAQEINGGHKVKISLKSIQVLNGGQTLRTIHEFNKMDTKNIDGNLSKAQVLLRIFKIESGLNNEIAEFTNSQNAISNIDLKSLRDEQLKLEQFLEDHNIIYARKSGDTGSDDTKAYEHKISMERFGQVLTSLHGCPERATNQKNAIFDKYYDEIFGRSLKIEESPKQIKRYFEIKNEYNATKFKVSEQKIFYILYLDSILKTSLIEIINEFEKLIDKYKHGEDISQARKLIQKGFKKFIDEKFYINNPKRNS